MAYIYKHIRKDTKEVFYIGIGKSKTRIKSHANRNNYWLNIVNKVGFESEIIEDNLTWQTACEKEVYWINYYGRIDNKTGTLVNMTDGGEGVFNISDESKLQMSLSKKGKVLSDEHRKNIGIASQKRWDDLDFRKKMMDSMKRGWNHSDEAKRKISDKLKGKPTWSKGKTHSEEHKRNNSLSKIGKTFEKVQCVHCGRFVAISKINLWHNDKCKNKLI
jgi:hypothetical protein